MASIKYGALGGELKGKVGGTIFQGGKSGSIVKSFLKKSFVKVLALIYGGLGTGFTFADAQNIAGTQAPGLIYPDGSRTAVSSYTNQRQLLATTASGWKNLTDEQRTAWNASAVNFPFKNRFGDQYTGSGFQVYMELNLNLAKNLLPILNFPPAPEAPTLPSILYPDPTTGDVLSINLPDGCPAGVRIMCFSSVGQSAGQTSKFKNPKLFAIIGEQDADTTINLRYLWQLYFGIVNENTKISVKFVPVSVSTGQAGLPLVYNQLIDAVASGAKLTKADAGKAFPATAADAHSDTTFTVSGYMITPGLSVILSGANATEFACSFDNDFTVDPILNADADQWGNLFPTPLYVRFQPIGGAGTRTATITYYSPEGTAIGTSILTGSCTG